VSTFVRLLGFLRPYRAGATWSLVLAAFAMVATVAIPWLTGLGIDAVARGDRGDVRMYAGLVAAAALVRVVLSVVRRIVAGRGFLWV
jgi:ABC-type multidrug transport system fused ATPase/permease subunit